MKKFKDNFTVDIKRATIWDCPSIAGLWKDMMEEVTPPDLMLPTDGKEPERFLKVLISKIDQKDSIIFVAKNNFRIIGFIIAYIYIWNYTPNLAGFCDAVYVTKKFRGQKIDNALIQTAEADAIAKGAKAFDFTAVRSQAWEQKGYKVIMTVHRKMKGEEKK